MKKPSLYRKFIDEMVGVCRSGQGQIAARRARAGVWHRDASARVLPEQHAINKLLKKLSASEREILAKMLADEVVTGVFETLKALEKFQIPPFTEGYEGSPFNDFVGRMDDWEWPEG